MGQTRLIALLTDYGHRDPYVGVVKGVIHQICPQAGIVDLCHEVPPQSVRGGCHMLSVSVRYFPADTIFVAVVDPGVGTSRRPIAVQSDGPTFIAPDNGLLSFLGPKQVHEIRLIKNEQFFLKPVSSTFHGRDIFAPAAAHLVRGIRLEDLGPSLKSFHRIEVPVPRKRGKSAFGNITWIDRFGNIVTNLSREHLPAKPLVKIRATEVRGLSRTYGDHPKGTLIALIGSGDRLEISLVEGNAAGALGVSIGDPVEVHSAG